MPIIGGKNSRGAMRSAAWLLRFGFVIAVVAAVWLTRPVPNPPGKPISELAPNSSAEPGGPNSRPKANLPQNSDSAPPPSDREDEPLADRIETTDDDSRTATATGESVDDSPLDPEVRRTLDLIAAGGPFPYRQDDTVFVNREGRLPKQSLGYYREFTVETPGSDDRGPRRIVRGKRGELFFTEDHYRTFVRIDDRPGSGPPKRDRQPSRGLNSSRDERSR